MKFRILWLIQKALVPLPFLLAMLVLFSAVVSQSNQSLAQNISQRKFYLVKSNENISIILFKLGLKPIYGAGGYLEKTIAHNKNISVKNADRVFNGDQIDLSFLPDQFANACMTLSASGEIIPSYAQACHELMAKNAGRSLAYIQKRYVANVEPLQNQSTNPVSAENNLEPKLSAVLNEPSETLSEFTFALLSGYTGVFGLDHSNATRGELLSQINSGLEFQWQQNWSDVTKTRLEMSGKRVDLTQTNDNKSLSNSSQTLYAFEFGLYRQFNSWFTMGLNADSRNYLAYRAKTSNLYQVDKLTAQTNSIVASTRLLEKKSLSLEAEFQYGWAQFAPDEFYSPESGVSYGMDLLLRHRRSSYGAFGRVGFSKTDFTVRQVEFENQNLDFSLGWTWDWAD